MNDKTNRNAYLGGVGCQVTGCKYHTTDNCCCADNITVKNENAVKKAETFCSTFVPKGIL